MLRKRIVSGMLVLAIGVFSLGSSSYAYGQFRGSIKQGKQKKDTTLHRAFPPRVYITGTAIDVQGKGGKGIDPAHVSRLTSMVESRLCSNAPRFKPASAKPETVISLNVTMLDAQEKWEDHAVTERHKTDQQVYNEKKKKMETKAVFQNVAVTKRFKVVKGAINVTYQVKDMTKRGNAPPLDSDSLTARYDENGIVYGDRTLAQSKKPSLWDRIFSRETDKKNMFLDGNGAPTQEEIKQQLLEEIVYQVVARLAPPTEPVKVLLPRGDWDEVSDLGKHGLWQKMLDTLEAMPPKKPKDDSYRLYAIGLAYEAKAYKADTLEDTIDLIIKAQLKYDEAYDKNPGEEYFLEPQARIRQAREQYEKLKNQHQEDLRSKGEDGSKSLPITSQNPAVSGNTGKQTNSTPPPAGALTNEQLIDLAGKGIDEAGLIDSIKRARVVQFDLSPEGKMQLLEGGVSNKVINAMSARQGARTPGRRK